MSDYEAKVLGGVLAAIATGLITGCALLVQTSLNNKRERNRQRTELAEARRREEAAARADWAAAFQEAYVAVGTAMAWWLELSPGSGDGTIDRSLKATEQLAVAKMRVHVTVARLLVMERDPLVRAFAQLSALSLETNLRHNPDPAQRATAVQRESDRLVNLQLAFMSLMEMLAGVRDEASTTALTRKVVEGSTLPPEVKANLLSAMDAKQASTAIATKKGSRE